MAGISFSTMRLVFRNAFNLERNSASAHYSIIYPEVNKFHQIKRIKVPNVNLSKDVLTLSMARSYSKHHDEADRGRQNAISDSDSDSDSDTESMGLERSNFWRRKMRTVHSVFDVDKDGLISYNDWQLFAERFKSLGHLDEKQGNDFSRILKLTWEAQWGPVDPYNLVSVEQYIQGMDHTLNDKSMKRKCCRWLPYLFRAVDKDRSGFISLKEFKLFYECLGLHSDHAAVAFAIIDTNSDGKLSLKEFVKLGKDFFYTSDQTRVSKMFWGPLIDD